MMLIEKLKNNLKNKVGDQEHADFHEKEGTKHVDHPKMGFSKLIKMVQDNKQEIELGNCNTHHAHGPLIQL